MTSSSSTAEPRQVTVELLDLDGLRKRYLDPLGKAITAIEELSLHLQSVAGYIDSPNWEAKLERPPTVADLGAIAIFIDGLEGDAGHLNDQIAHLRHVWPTLSSLHEENLVSAD